MRINENLRGKLFKSITLFAGIFLVLTMLVAGVLSIPSSVIADSSHTSGGGGVDECELTLTKTGPATTTPGAEITYNLKLENTGNVTCTGSGVLLYDYFPTNASFVSYDISKTPKVNSGSVIGWNFNKIATTSPVREVNLKMKVDDDVKCGSKIVNKAIFKADKYTGDNSSYEWGAPVYATTTVVCGSISGHKYKDADTLASTTADRTGASGWTINLLDQASTTIASTTTAGNSGYYEFTALPFGVYYLTEEMKAGWAQLSAPKDPIILISTAADSPDNDFVNYARECQLKLTKTGPATVGPGDDITYNLKLENTGKFTCTGSGVLLSDYFPVSISFKKFDLVNLANNLKPSKTSTTSNPVYWNFDKIATTSPLREVNLTMQVSKDAECGSVIVNEARFKADKYTNVNKYDYSGYAYATTTVACAPELGAISGYKYEDADGATSTPDQTVLPNWTINLLDSASTTIASTTTDSSGYYEFSDLPLDQNYYLTEDMESGWYQLESPNNPVFISTTTATSSLNNNFINSRLGSISGHKYKDADGLIGTTGDQTGAPGWTINLLDQASTTIASTTTAGNDGYYEFTALPLGVYYLTEEMKTGWNQLFAPEQPIILKSTATSSPDNDFVNYARECQLKLTKTGPATTTPGAEITYNLTLENTGTAKCTGSGVIIKDNFDQNTTFVSADTIAKATTTESIKWNFGIINPNDPVINVGLTMKVSDNAKCGSKIVNEAKFWSQQTDWGDPVYATTTVACGDISGYKYEDMDDNIDTAGDWHGLDNWVINLFDSNSTIIASTTTSNLGYYEFDNLPLGYYSLTENMKSGWIQLAAPTPITLTSTATSSVKNNFVNTKPGFISGYKYKDSDGLISTTNDREGLPDWYISLYASTSMGVIPSATIVTDSNGYFEFKNLPLGTYILTENMKSGWNQLVAPNPITLIPTATSSAENNFVNYLLPEGPDYGYLKICKYVDMDGNLGTTGDQSPVGGWEFIVDSGTATSSYSTLTQDQAVEEERGYGCTETIKLETGDYDISEVLGNGWYAIDPKTGSTTVEIEANKEKTVDFYNTQYSKISGYKYNDANNNGKIDADENALSGWEIRLVGCPYAPSAPGSSSFLPKSRINLNPIGGIAGSCSVIATTTTNMEGFYSFDMLMKGDYGVSETDQSDWTQTYPENQTFYYFNLGKGEATTTINFLNHYEKPPYCGDGIVNQTTEQCDGSDGISEHQSCTSDCTIENVPYCGDNICNADENCSSCVSDCGGCGGSVIISGNHNPKTPIVLGKEGDPILSIDKTVNMVFANPGDEIEYKVVIANSGNLTAFDVTLDDTLPDGFTFSNDGTATRFIDVGDIEPNESKTFNYDVTIGDAVAAGVYTNTAVAAASNYDPISDSADIEVKKIEILGTELAETGFSVKEFALLLGIIFSSYGFALILKRKYGLNK